MMLKNIFQIKENLSRKSTFPIKKCGKTNDCQVIGFKSLKRPTTFQFTFQEVNSRNKNSILLVI